MYLEYNIECEQNHICPFCGISIPEIPSTFRTRKCYFNMERPHIEDKSHPNADILLIEMLYCPTCKKVSFYATGQQNLEGYSMPMYPTSLAKHFPEYVPSFIKEDYEEAYSILTLSPKASATLSRRCLQGMIRDFHGISKATLFDEINEIQSLIPVSQWKAIDATRSIGNIGAHMEKDVNVIIDVDPGEAEQLLKLIELLIDKWYIARHDEDELYKNIVNTANIKKAQKKSNS